MEYAEHEFELDARQKDGSTLREHLENVARQTGRAPEQLIPVDEPDAVMYIWDWFLELSAGRTWTEFGPGPLSYTDIAAWASIRRIDVEPWELAALKKLDTAYLKK